MRLATLVIPTLLLVISVPLGLVIANDLRQQGPSAGDDDLQVQTRGATFIATDPIRIWLRNEGEETIHGSPRLMIMRLDGGIQQSFAPGQFQLELKPDEAVWIDWTPSPNANPCSYGRTSGGTDFEAAGAIPCNAPMEGPGSTCYACRGTAGPTDFVLVGTMGTHADAHVIRVEPVRPHMGE